MKQVFEKIKQRITIAATEACGYAALTRVVSEAEVKEILDSVVAEYNNGWIPCSERLPENDDYILLSFENFSLPLVGRYDKDGEIGGAFYIGDCDGDDTCVSNNLFVNAWQPLPEPYKPGKEKRHTNADRIRDMSDEDLVEFMYSSDIPWCDDKICREDDNGCRECLKKWLRSEVEVSDEQ